MDADLELAAEADVVIGKGEVGTAAGTGEQALHIVECFDLFLGHFADFANGAALGDAAVFDELDLGIEERGEFGGWLVGNGVFLGEAAGDGRANGRVDEGGVEEFRIADEGADGEVKRAVRGHNRDFCCGSSRL